MRQIEGNNYTRKGKHLSWEERIQIETLQREGFSPTLIGKRLHRSVRTIRREIKRGWVLHRTGKYTVEDRYSADRGQSVYERRMSSKTKAQAVDKRLVEYLRVHIVQYKESPGVIAARMKNEALEFAVCAKTIYNLIDRGLINGVSNESLWEKRLRNKKKKKVYRHRKKAVAPEHSIENRPAIINERKEAGHWEIDLVVGGKGKGKCALLTLTERTTRKQIIRKIKNKEQKSVVRAINGIERQMGKEGFSIIFKSITADNGSEFLDHESLEHSVYGGSRTHIYYAHPYSSWERGSNERANRIIRRFIPKGSDISKYTRKQIQAIEDWINNYPRKILDFETPEERFIRELAA